MARPLQLPALTRWLLRDQRIGGPVPRMEGDLRAIVVWPFLSNFKAISRISVITALQGSVAKLDKPLTFLVPPSASRAPARCPKQDKALLRPVTEQRLGHKKPSPGAFSNANTRGVCSMGQCAFGNQLHDVLEFAHGATNTLSTGVNAVGGRPNIWRQVRVKWAASEKPAAWADSVIVFPSSAPSRAARSRIHKA